MTQLQDSSHSRRDSGCEEEKSEDEDENKLDEEAKTTLDNFEKNGKFKRLD